MAGGSALLAMAGPVGWAIGGAALATSGLILEHENKKIGKEANSRAFEIEGLIPKVNASKQEVELIEKETIRLADLISSEIQYLQKNAPKDYPEFSQPFKERLVVLINSIHVLSQLLKKTVDLKL